MFGKEIGLFFAPFIRHSTAEQLAQQDFLAQNSHLAMQQNTDAAAQAVFRTEEHRIIPNVLNYFTQEPPLDVNNRPIGLASRGWHQIFKSTLPFKERAIVFGLMAAIGGATVVDKIVKMALKHDGVLTPKVSAKLFDRLVRNNQRMNELALAIPGIGVAFPENKEVEVVSIEVIATGTPRVLQIQNNGQVFYLYVHAGEPARLLKPEQAHELTGMTAPAA